MRSKKIKMNSNKKHEDICWEDCDDSVIFIAGYTSWGVPYGIMTEEIEIDADIEKEEVPFN